MADFPSSRRAASLLAALLIGWLALSGGAARAQGFFGSFFGQPQPPQPQAQPYPYQPRYNYYYRAPRRRVVAPRPHVVEPKDDVVAAPKPPSPNASRFVVVLGDSLGQLLADGLDEALADRQDVAVLHRARDSTGLVREDFYNWPKAVADLVAKSTPAKSAAPERSGPDKKGAQDKLVDKDRIDVAVIMIGSNDRQSITENGKTYAPGTDEWTAAYTKRATTLAEALKARNIPLIWVGVPIVKNDDFADAMAGLNEIYKEVAARTGAVYVDTWEAFSDDDGDFSAYGPDINGQTVRLRSADGIHFTKAGARKLAHFVETHVRRALDQQKLDMPMPATATPEASGKPVAKSGPVPPAKPDIGPVKVLTEAPKAEDGRLQSPYAYKDKLSAEAAVENAMVKGVPQPAHPGRADDASWPPP